MILIVEDDPEEAELALAALERTGLVARAAVARDGCEALERLCGGRSGPPPRLILLDLKLPKVGGIEVLARLKADPRTRVIPVVVLTSSREPDDVRRCAELGANSYVVKAVDFERFSAEVAQIGAYWLGLHEAAPAQGENRPG